MNKPPNEQVARPDAVSYEQGRQAGIAEARPRVMETILQQAQAGQVTFADLANAIRVNARQDTAREIFEAFKFKEIGHDSLADDSIEVQAYIERKVLHALKAKYLEGK